MLNCVHFCQKCLRYLDDQKQEAKEFYDFFCHFHGCTDFVVVLEGPLDDEEKYCLSVLETEGYVISSEVGDTAIGILPKRFKYNDTYFYCSGKCQKG